MSSTSRSTTSRRVPHPAPPSPSRPPREEEPQGAGDSAGALALLTAHGLHALPPTGRLVLGRGPQADCPLSNPRVAARHCAVEQDPHGSLWVQALRGGSDTRLRGRLVERAPLTEGDALLVGGEPVLVVRAGAYGWSDAVRWRGLVVRDPASHKTLTAIGRLGPHDLPVLVHGESGVGKELVARALHGVSDRASGPWVAVNCAALTDTLAEATLFGVRRGAFTGATHDRPGVFEEAHGGTLLLDEVGELSPALQAKLLRALEAGEVTRVGEVRPRSVDVRVIAATWRDLEAESASGGFRHDLLHRLAVLRLEIPPLRARPADIGPLYAHFRHATGADAPRPGAAELAALTRRAWPGNARELRNAAMREVVLGSKLRTHDGELAGGLEPRAARDDEPQAHTPTFPASEVPAPQAPEGLLAQSTWRLRHETRRARAAAALWRARGNRAKAARALGVSRSTLYRWLNLPRPEAPLLAAPGPPREEPLAAVRA